MCMSPPLVWKSENVRGRELLVRASVFFLCVSVCGCLL